MPNQFKIAIIGDYYGPEEALWKRPFVGQAANQFDALLRDAGIERSECFITTVFALQPAAGLESLCCPPKSPEREPGLRSILPGLYLKREHAGEIRRLHSELAALEPNVALLLGPIACWALLDTQAVSKIRGTACHSSSVPGLKCLPTYHPRAVTREYSLRHVTVLDWIKAKREGEFPELRRPARIVQVAETIEDVRAFKREYLDSAARISFDIETASGQITCIGFAASIERALVIPFVDATRPEANYWRTLADELTAWDLVAQILSLPAVKLGQNGLYDIQYLWMAYGIPVHNYTHDTMLLHHALQPESDKGLGFLGSVYTNESAWKVERPRGEHSIKKEE